MAQLPNNGQKVPQQAATGPQLRKLKKGEVLFSEGENSRAMYLVKSGLIRIFKKKGDGGAIEIDTIRAGQVLGELAFLDGNPRSASGEALSDCELVEISGPTFTAVLGAMPDWLKILLKTVVGRLRTASTRIRQLESASTSFNYSDKDGKLGQKYVYMPNADVLKTCLTILAVASRNGKKIEGQNTIEVSIPLINRYANQMCQIPEAKVTTLLDVLTQCDILQMPAQGANPDLVMVKDINYLEEFMNYLNDENLQEASKRKDISIRGFYVMNLIAKHIAKFPKDEKGFSLVNIAEIRAAEKDSFQFTEVNELVRLGYATAIGAKDTENLVSQINMESFVKAHRLQRVMVAIMVANDQKSKGAAAGKAA